MRSEVKILTDDKELGLFLASSLIRESFWIIWDDKLLRKLEKT